MARWIETVLQTLAAARRARRRAANLRAGARPAPMLRKAPAPATTPSIPSIPSAPAAPRPASAPSAAAAGGQTTANPAPRAARRNWRFAPTITFWIGLSGAAAAIAGAVVLAAHARHLGQATLSTVQGADEVRAANAYQAVLPGVAFSVPARPELTLALQPGGALLVAAGLQSAKPVRVDLCSQLLDPAKPRVAPLRLGYRFEDVRRWVARNEGAASQVTLRNVLLVADQGRAAGMAMPEVQISGAATADFADPQSQPLQLSWRSAAGPARWISDASFGQIEEGPNGQVGLRQQGWLLWGEGAALRIERRASAACPQAGELLVQLFHAPDGGAAAPADGPQKALVTAFAPNAKAVSAYLAAGRYQVPAAPRASLEDQTLFLALQARGLLRQSAAGVIQIVPRDLPAWLASADAARAAELAEWRDVRLDKASLKLIKHLYQQADGAYVRQQIYVFNSELRLLAWRSRAGAAQAWQASLAGAPAATGGQMPPVAARLFSDLPQGWSPWTRATQWPQAQWRTPLRLTLALPTPASGQEQIALLLIGRVGAVGGARLRSVDACSGRVCRTPDAVQQLWLQPLPGARQVTVDAQALDTAALGGPGDQQYRHLRMVGGRLVWQPLNQAGGGLQKAPPPSPVILQDRNGSLLWADGAPTQPAVEAGLAPLLGLNADHGSSVAGMLARLPAPSTSRLTLDLALQTLSQRVLDCIGMRHGRWDGAGCAGGQAPPAGRHAGLVILDTETGDVLAAAGAGAGSAQVSAANWSEVRDFDQANPARSPLRLPALQHDGGAHQSPGSTFKVVSALGLEMAARGDPQIEALLNGLPLPAINRMARLRGYAFDTAAATYPLNPRNPRLAHITNYHEEGLDRRAQAGRLGLAQALTYSLNTWFAWSSELSDRSLFGRADGGAPDLQPLDPDALDAVRPIVAAAHRLGFEQAQRLDGGLLPADFNWNSWDALQGTPAHIDPIHTRHELRQMAIGLRMQTTPLQMALVAAAIGQGGVVKPRLLLTLGAAQSQAAPADPLGIRLDRIRAGMKGVVDVGTGAGAFGGPALVRVRAGLYGKTGTAPTIEILPDGSRRELATVWFTGWLEPGSLPDQPHRLAMAAFVSHSDGSGGEHAAPVLAAVLAQLAGQRGEQRAK